MKTMIVSILATFESASAAVAITLIMCPTIILTTAVIRHKMNDVVKLAGYFTTFLGFLLGAFITYFSTQPQIQRQEFQIRTIQGELQTSEKEKAAVGKEILDVATNIRRHGQSPESYQATEMLDPVCLETSVQNFYRNGGRYSRSQSATKSRFGRN